MDNLDLVVVYTRGSAALKVVAAHSVDKGVDMEVAVVVVAVNLVVLVPLVVEVGQMKLL